MNFDLLKRRKRREADALARPVARQALLDSGYRFPIYAEERAIELFLRHLTWQEKLYFAEKRMIRCKGSNGVEYLIHPNYVGNVEARDISYCGGPGESMPILDFMLAQKLLIETDANAFHMIAFPRNLP